MGQNSYEFFEEMIYINFAYYMRISQPLQKSESIFSCLFCLGGEEDINFEKRKEVVFIDQYKHNQPKVSLKAPTITTSRILPVPSQKTLAKSYVNRCSLRKKSENLHCNSQLHQQAEIIHSNKTIASPQKLLFPPQAIEFQKINSMLSTNDTNFQLTPKKDILPKINFIYKDNFVNPQYEPVKQSLIDIKGSFSSFPELEFMHQFSDINQKSITSGQARKSSEILIPDHVSHGSSSSPLNKLYKASNKDILVSKELRKKNSNSFDNPQKKLKRLSSLDGPFTKTMKIRQTQSIREPQDESQLYSVVITNSLINSHLGLLVPIDQNEYQTKLSDYRE